jgi:hypothetical protein
LLPAPRMRARHLFLTSCLVAPLSGCGGTAPQGSRGAADSGTEKDAARAASLDAKGDEDAVGALNADAGNEPIDLTGSVACGQSTCTTGQICFELGCSDAPTFGCDAGSGDGWIEVSGETITYCCKPTSSAPVFYACVDSPPTCGSRPTCNCLEERFFGTLNCELTPCNGRTLKEELY